MPELNSNSSYLNRASHPFVKQQKLGMGMIVYSFLLRMGITPVKAFFCYGFN